MGYSARRAAVQDALVTAALAGAVAIEAWGWWAELAAGAGLAAAVVLGGRRWPVAALLAGAAVNLLYLADLSAEVWLVLVSVTGCLLAGRRMPNGLVALPCFAAVALAGLLAAIAAGDVWDWIGAAGTLLFFGVLPFLAGQYARLRAVLAEAGWQRAEQLERERRLVAEEARLRERARIARDMHDSLGHELSLLALRSGALEMDPGLDDRYRQTVAGLRAGVVDATERLQDIIDVLRDEVDRAPAGPGQESIAELVARSRASGMDIEFVHDGHDGTVGQVAYRVVQEALTNAAKHAPGARVVVRLTRTGAGTAVTVTNGRPPAGGPGPIAAGGGRGLAGLRDRVRQVGGSLWTAERDGGYQVVARLPAPTSGTEQAPAESESARHLSDLRRTARRGLVVAAAVSGAATAVVALALLGLRAYEVTHSSLDPATYRGLRLGQLRADIAGRLPVQQVDGRPDVPEPPVPAGARCEYYRVSEDLFAGPIDVYRLCFAGGRLVGKDLIPAVAP